MVQQGVKDNIHPETLILIAISYIASVFHFLVIYSSKKMRKTDNGKIVMIIAIY